MKCLMICLILAVTIVGATPVVPPKWPSQGGGGLDCLLARAIILPEPKDRVRTGIGDDYLTHACHARSDVQR
jgi:hypothetical protein